jgi:putative transposase
MDDIRTWISDDTWQRLGLVVQQAKRSRAGAPPKLEDRAFLEALLYLARTGCPWRDLPACFGDWNAAYQRFRRWLAAGVWQRLFAASAEDELLQPICRVFVDSTIVRAHPHAAGAPAEKGGKKPRGWAAAGAALPASCTWPARTSARPSQCS